MKKFVSTYDRITQESKAEGKVEGKVEGRAETILRLLSKRFGQLPPATSERVKRGSSADLDRWTDRLLDAATLADVFADARST